MPARKTFLLRLSQELYAEIQAWAEQDLRSINGQIEFLLREAVSKRRAREGEPGKKGDGRERRP